MVGTGKGECVNPPKFQSPCRSMSRARKPASLGNTTLALAHLIDVFLCGLAQRLLQAIKLFKNRPGTTVASA